MKPADRFEIGAPSVAPAPPAPSPEVPPRATIGGWFLVGLLVVGAFAIILLGMQSPVFDLERYGVPKALALHGVALLALAVLLARWRRIELGLVEGLLVAYVLWSAASALLATNHWLALSGLGLSLSGLVVYCAARRVAPEHGRALAAGLALAGALGSALGVAQAYGADWSFLGTTRPPGGTFGNRNFLAHLTAIAAPLMLLLRIRARGRLTAFFAAAALMVAAAAIVLTRSRAAWLGLAAALLAMALGTLVGRRSLRATAVRPPRRVRGAVLGLALGAAAAVVVPNRLDWRSSNPYSETLTRITDYRGGSGKGRIVQYRNSFKLLKYDPIFGVGPGNWFVHYPRVTSPGDRAFDTTDPIPTNPWPSSDWVTFFVERGPVGGLLLLAAFLAAMLACLRGARSGDRERALGSIALLGTLAAAFVCGLFDAVLLLPAPLFFAMAALGALLPRPGRPVLDRPIAGKPRLIASLAILLTTIAVTAVTAGQLYALLITQQSISNAAMRAALAYDPGDYRLNLIMMARGSCSRRLPYARAAADLLPYHPAPRRALRECGVRLR
jgi:O-antigen ligase